jgi:hypothetical protein
LALLAGAPGSAATVTSFSLVDYSASITDNVNNLFEGACLAGNGKVVLAPNKASKIGVYDRHTALLRLRHHF